MLLICFFSLLLSGFINCMFGRFLGIRGSFIIALMGCFISFLSSLTSFIESSFSLQLSSYILFNWFEINTFYVLMEFISEPAGCLMSLTVSGITTCVMLFTGYYMLADPSLPRFFGYLCFFAGFMVVLVTSANLLVLIIGWEGIGIVSFQLIGFWFERLNAVQSALKAILVNRISDVCLMLGICFIWFYFGSIDFSLFYLIEPNFFITFVSFLFVFGSMAKSAQFGLHVWLYDAMEGPTPVSALIHSATLVTAGVFLLCKSTNLWFSNVLIKNLLLIIGCLTAFTGALAGLGQLDLKKIIAFSTCSQLGFMFVGLGLLAPTISLYHAITHALFKAGLFIVAGSVIGLSNSQQDIRLNGSLLFVSWLGIAVHYVCCSLSGIFFTSGYYSKDMLVEYGGLVQNPFSNWAICLLYITISITSWYSSDIQNIVLYYNTQTKISTLYTPSTHFFGWLPVCFISISSLFIGFLFEDGWNIQSWLNVVYDINSLNQFVALFTFVFIIIGFFQSISDYQINLTVLCWLSCKLGFDWFYHKTFGFFILYLSDLFNFTIEHGLLELYGSHGLLNVNYTLTKWFKNIFLSNYKQNLLFIVILFWLLLLF